MSLESNPSRWDTSGKPRSPVADSALESPGRAPERSGTAAAPARASIAPKEKRRHPRFKCEGNLELKTDGSTIRTWATFTDISATGCYVEMMTTFPVGTQMELQLGMNGFLVVGKAIVRATYPFLGMGIEFISLPQNSREQLESMVASVTSMSTSRPNPAPSAIALPPIPQPAAVIDALAHYFSVNRTLSTDEFIRLVKESQPGNS